MTNITRRVAALVGVLFMAMALGCASTAKQEGTGEYIDDTVITTKVKAAILNEPTLKSAEINVETFKGVVQLSGFVSTQAAENTAVRMPMVSVTANPRIGPAPSQNMMAAAASVVSWLSKMVMTARWKPCSMAEIGDLPERSSSRMRS